MSLGPEYLVAFSIGFLGSIHCLGMCGPIALITPSLFAGTLGRLLGGMIYHLGRIITYSAVGGLLGLLGLGFALFEWQQSISVILGLIIISSVVLPKLNLLSSNIVSKVYHPIKWSLAKLIGKRGFVGILSIGLVNGLLPCGLVYIGLAGSIDAGSAPEGALFMAFFGLGTTPMLTGVHLLGMNLKGAIQKKMTKLIPIITFVIGLLFLIRGLGLGIPYLSPKLVSHEAGIECHLPEHRHK